MISNYEIWVVCSHKSQPAVSHIWTVWSKSAFKSRLSDQRSYSRHVAYCVQSHCIQSKSFIMFRCAVGIAVIVSFGFQLLYTEKIERLAIMSTWYILFILHLEQYFMIWNVAKSWSLLISYSTFQPLFFPFYVYKFGCYFLDDRTMIFLKNLVQKVRQVAFNLWRIRK